MMRHGHIFERRRKNIIAAAKTGDTATIYAGNRPDIRAEVLRRLIVGLPQPESGTSDPVSARGIRFANANIEGKLDLAKRRIAWLKKQYQDPDEPTKDEFRPQPFTQLAKVLRGCPGLVVPLYALIGAILSAIAIVTLTGLMRKD